MREASSSPTTSRAPVSSPTTRRIRWLPIILIATFSVYRLLYYSSDGGLLRSLSDVDNSPRRTIDIEKSYVDDRILTHHREKDTIAEESNDGYSSYNSNGHILSAYQYRREEKTNKFTPTFKNSWILPNTSFTPYLLTLVDFYEQNYIACQSNMTITGGNGVTLQITTPSAYSTTPPIVKQSVGFKFLKLFQNGFLNNRTLPPDSSITLRVSKKDKDQAEERCFFAASSPGGKHSIYNFQDMKLWVDNTTHCLGINVKLYQYSEERCGACMEAILTNCNGYSRAIYKVITCQSKKRPISSLKGCSNYPKISMTISDDSIWFTFPSCIPT